MYPGSGAQRHRLPEQERSTKRCLHCSDVDPKLLVAGSEAGSVLGWNLKTRISTLLKPGVFRVSGLASMQALVPRAWSFEAPACTCHLRSEPPTHLLPGAQGWTTGVAYKPGSPEVIYCCGDDELKMIDVRTGVGGLRLLRRAPGACCR
jgi:hypothetical protein